MKFLREDIYLIIKMYFIKHIISINNFFNLRTVLLKIFSIVYLMLYIYKKKYESIIKELYKN